MSRPATGRYNCVKETRLLLAMAVVASHAPQLMDGDRRRELLTRACNALSLGEVAVLGFFLLSGYFAILGWEQRPRAIPFLCNRGLRIYPAYTVACLACALVVGPLASDASAYVRSFDPLAFARNVVLLRGPATPPVFVGLPNPAINGSLWTLPYDFALQISVAVLGGIGALRPRVWFGLTCVVLGVMALHAASMEFRIPGTLLTSGHGLFRVAGAFSVGGCFCLYRDRIRFSTWWSAACAAAVAVALSSRALAPLALVTGGAYVLFHVAFRRRRSASRFSRLPDVSFGVFLYGWPMQNLLLWWTSLTSPAALAAYSAVVSAGLGLASWYLVERPFARMRSRGTRGSALACAEPSPDSTVPAA